jgi:hypothetical protein
MALIKENENILIKLPSGSFKCITIRKRATIQLGKFGRFDAVNLIGLPYDIPYQIVDRGAIIVAKQESLLDTLGNHFVYLYKPHW